jgi:hypothetical protein
LSLEALVELDDFTLVLSDDGKRKVDGKDCKDLEKEGKPVFFRWAKLSY